MSRRKGERMEEEEWGGGCVADTIGDLFKNSRHTDPAWLPQHSAVANIPSGLSDDLASAITQPKPM